jgi:hypothetical protein
MINYYLFQMKRMLSSNKGEFGIGAIMGVAITLTIAAFVVMPGLITFTESVLGGLNTWWGTVADGIFDSTPGTVG